MKRRIVLLLLITNMILVGCWDQHQLVNKTLVNGVSFDLTEDEEIKGAVRALTIQSKGGGQFEILDEIVSSVKPTDVGMEIEANSMSAGEIDFSKSHIILLGEDLAKKGIQMYLEPFYRNKDSYISSKVLITKGKAFDIISTEEEKSPIAFYILQMLTGLEETTIIPNETTFLVWKQILDPKKDIILPYLEKKQSGKIAVAGVALLNGEKFTGKTLSKDQSSLLLLLMNQLKKTGRMGLILNKETKQSVAFNVINMKRDFSVSVEKRSKKINSKINLTLEVEVLSYPQNFKKDIDIQKLNKELSVVLTKKAKEVTDILLQANCDPFGIGSRVASFHPEIWKTMNWEKEYPNVQIDPDVKVEITKTGNVF